MRNLLTWFSKICWETMEWLTFSPSCTCTYIFTFYTRTKLAINQNTAVVLVDIQLEGVVVDRWPGVALRLRRLFTFAAREARSDDVDFDVRSKRAAWLRPLEVVGRHHCIDTNQSWQTRTRHSPPAFATFARWRCQSIAALLVQRCPKII